jgi:hypothetical protein
MLSVVSAVDWVRDCFDDIEYVKPSQPIPLTKVKMSWIDIALWGAEMYMMCITEGRYFSLFFSLSLSYLIKCEGWMLVTFEIFCHMCWMCCLYLVLVSAKMIGII